MIDHLSWMILGTALGSMISWALLHARHADQRERLRTADSKLREAETLRRLLDEAHESRAALQARVDAIPTLQATVDSQALRLDELNTLVACVRQDNAQLTTRLEYERSGREEDRNALTEIPSLRHKLGCVTEERAVLAAQAESIPKLHQETLNLKSCLDEARERNTTLELANTKLAAQFDEAVGRVSERADFLQIAETRLRDTFESLASGALKNNNEAFLHLAHENIESLQREGAQNLKVGQERIGALLDPVQDTLRRLEASVHDLEVQRAGAYAGLKTQVEVLKEGQTQLSAQTGSLVRALRAPSPRGRWGEIQLKRVVEMAGMVEHCDFTEQAHVPTEDGRLRPDLIVHLPGGKKLVVDSKVPLSAYLDAVETTDESTRKSCLHEHARQLKNHITELGSKAYWDQLSASPDFVLMFVQIETAFEAAVQEDVTLIDYAVARSVIPAGPMTLLAHLKAAAYGWQQERIAENAQEISNLGKSLYNRLCTLAGHFTSMGNALRRTVEAYNEAVGSIERRVLVQARKFKELGATTGDEVPEPQPVDLVPRTVHFTVEGDTAIEETQDPETIAAREGT